MMQKKNIESIYRLSPTQEGILYQCLKEPDAGYYHSQFSCRLTSLKDTQKWQQVWTDLVAQHAVLRTFFTWEKRDQPLQIVRERVTLPWQSFDWSNESELQIEQKWSGLIRRDKDLGFNLSKAPLIRFSLAKTGSETYLFLMSFHHILLDGWSQRLLFSEAFNAYAANDYESLSDYQQSSLNPVSFEQFINWISLQDKQAVNAHWTSYLNGFRSPTLISDTSLNLVGVSEISASKSTFLDFTSDEVAELQRTARQYQVTLNNLFSAALAIHLASVTNQSDVVFGTTVSGRPSELSGCDRTAGMFINTLPLRGTVDSDQDLGQWLKELQSDQAANLQFSHSSLSDIQKLTELPQGKVLFDTILVVENLPVSNRTDSAECTGNQLNVDQVNYQEYSHYPLAILVDLSDGIRLIAIYQSEIIQSAKADEILLKMASILHKMTDSREQRVRSICDNSAETSNAPLENQALLAIHHYFEYQVGLNPKKLAIQASGINCDEKLTYFELNQRANRLAHYLINHRVAKGSAVAVVLDRGVRALISFLAILKAGAAYVPVDASHPSERIAIILTELNTSGTLENFAVLTDEKNLQLVLTNSTIINFDKAEQQALNLVESNPDTSFKDDTLAYIIYTSGSTGTPKGVMVSHQNLINSTLARKSYYPSQPEVFLVLSSLATDSSIAGIYWSLCSGGSLIVSATRAEQDPMSLGRLIEQNGVTHLLCIPSLYFLLLENIPSSQLSCLNTVIVAGEACAESVITQHQTKLPSTKFYNEYGPSEFTVWATVSQLNDWQSGQPIPIGKPIANTSILLLDKEQQPVEKGAVGELYLGGANLAQGYLDDKVKTQQQFVHNSCADIENQPSILYKTGDLVRYCDDDNLIFVGRTDNQIKVRGNRLEPEEVESVLNSHPDVLESVVFLQDGSSTDIAPTELVKRLAELSPELIQKLLKEIEL